MLGAGSSASLQPTSTRPPTRSSRRSARLSRAELRRTAGGLTMQGAALERSAGSANPNATWMRSCQPEPEHLRRAQVSTGLGRRFRGGRSLEWPIERARPGAVQVEVPPVGRLADRAGGTGSLRAATPPDGPVRPHRMRHPHYGIQHHGLQAPEEPRQPGPAPEGPPIARMIVVAGHVGLRFAVREPELDRFPNTRPDRRHGGHRLIDALAVLQGDDQVYVTRPTLLAAQASE